jgi:hypothetical protein
VLIFRDFLIPFAMADHEAHRAIHLVNLCAALGLTLITAQLDASMR